MLSVPSQPKQNKQNNANRHMHFLSPTCLQRLFLLFALRGGKLCLCLVRSILHPDIVFTRLDLVLDNAPQQLDSKADKVVLSEVVLKLPCLALLVFGFERFGISQLTGTDALVLGDGEEVEADFVFGVTSDSLLEDFDNLLGEFVLCAGAVRDRGTLKSVELVELVVDHRVGDKVEGFVVVGSGALGFVNEGGGAGKAVVDGTNNLWLKIKRLEEKKRDVSERLGIPEFDKVSPFKSGGNSPAKSLNSARVCPMLTELSWLRSTLIMAWVAQAFCIVWFAKKMS